MITLSPITHGTGRARRNGIRLALPLALVLALSACGGIPETGGLESVHQPVVSHASFSLDLTSGPGGLSPDESERLTGWLEAMDLRYGDHVSLEDPLASPATRASVQAALAPRGMMLDAPPPPPSGYVNAGTVRVVLTRASASVPHCPDWTTNSESNPRNGNSSNFGCAINSNIAAMVADPDDLIHGKPSTGVVDAHRSGKAVQEYLSREPSGKGELKKASTKDN